MLQGKMIVLGVSGGIAAYKAAALCSRLTQAGADVHVIMSESAVKFIAPLTFQTLSRNPVTMSVFDEIDPQSVYHIHLADKANLMIIAPATANTIAKLALGLADDMLTTTYLATRAPVMIAPAMNGHMLAKEAVQQNIATLRQRGAYLIEPGEGQLACGYVGKGRMIEPEELFERAVHLLQDKLPLAGKRLLVTAGGTIERIDPVRYLSNDSSGKMGYAIAETARHWGAEVTLVSAASLPAPQGVTVVPAYSAKEMYDAVLDRYDEMDIVIKAAAVADYRPVHVSDRKMKKSGDSLTIELEKTEDILQTLGERKTSQFLVGFAAETNNVESYALDKLQRKNCDLLVANDVSKPDAGFGVDTNIVSIYDRNGLVEHLPIMSKHRVAERLLQMIADRLDSSNTGANGNVR